VWNDSDKEQMQREAAAAGEHDVAPDDEVASADEAAADEGAADEAAADEAAADEAAAEDTAADDAAADAAVADETADQPAPPVDAESLFLDLPDEPAATDPEAAAPGADAADTAADAPDETDLLAAHPDLVPDPETGVSEAELLDAVPLELSAEELAEIERKSRMQWFVIHANTGHENKVKRDIDMAIKSGHMEEYFGEVLVPTQEVTEMKNGKRSTVKRKFFPSYILVEMIMNKKTHHFINSIPGVTRFIGGTPLKPEPITKDEADRILGRISGPEEGKETLEIPYEIGDSVQVMDGPFTEWIGVINEINHDKGKLKVMISIFGSETPVELDFLQVKPV
jgi:transcriptional antiterminator NusG